MKAKYTLGLCVGGLLAELLIAGPAFAADASQPVDTPPTAITAKPDSGLQEIVVTARKRDETLQSTPVAVSELSSDLLQKTVSTNALDVAKFSPNVVLGNVTYSAAALGASIRGLSFSDLEKTFDPTVGVSIDGVFLAWNTGALFDLDDVASVEILRGPQGTLYGRNTIGGTISIRRTKPTGQWGVKAYARFGSYSQFDTNIVLNAPIVDDKLALKLTYGRHTGDSFTVNAVTNMRDPGPNVNTFGAALRLTPNPDLEMLLSLDYSRDRSHYPPALNMSKPGELVCDLGAGVFGVPSACSTGNFDVAAASGFRTSFAAIPFYTPADTYAATFETDWNVAGGKITAISGYRYISEDLQEENTGTLPVLVAPGVSVPFIAAFRPQRSYQWSQEVRYASQFSGRFNFVLGAYYMYSHYRIFPETNPLGTGDAEIFFLGSPLQSYRAGQGDNVASVFGEGIYKLTDKARLTIGGRLNYERKTFYLDFLDPATGQLAVPSIDRAKSFTDPTWRAILDYQFTPDLFGYASYSRGFRSGGFNGRAASADAVGPYNPEHVGSWEAGLRTEFFDHHLRINPTVFYALYTNKQEELLVGLPGGGTETTVYNAASAKIWGAELESQAKLSDALALRMSAGYLGYEYSKFSALDPRPGSPTEGQVIDISSTARLRRAPKWTFNFGGDYSLPTSFGKLTLTSDYHFTDKFYAASVFFSVDPRAIVSPQNVLDASLTFDFDRRFTGLPGDLSLTLYGKDVGYGHPGRNTRPFDATPNFYFTNPSPATSYGVEIHAKF